MTTPKTVEASKPVKSADHEQILALKNRVLAGGEVSFQEAMELISVTDEPLVDFILESAKEITFHFNADKPGLCSLVNAKSNLCGEDCGFCSQSIRFETRVDRYQMMPTDEVVRAAKDFEKRGAAAGRDTEERGKINLPVIF